MAGKPKQMERDGLGEAIQKARLKAKMSQAQLATAIGVKQPVIARYERTGAIRDKGRLTKIARALKITTDDLLGLNEPVTYYKIENGKMHRFVEEIDQGLVDLPEGEVQHIAAVVNLMIDKALERPTKEPRPKNQLKLKK